MLSKNKIKYIQSLSRKKVRDMEQAFLVEGNKMVLEAINSDYPIDLICATKSFEKEHLLSQKSTAELIECSTDEIKKASLQQNPQQALAVLRIPEKKFLLENVKNELCLALDFIQDPGNLGTIIRIADWFGIKHVLCSTNTVDCFNPKAIQASMGSIFRVDVHYLDLQETLKSANKLNMPTFGTFLKGENIYQSDLSKSGILVMGNEGKGISTSIEGAIQYKIHIPSFPSGNSDTESLNVATATAICCSEFRSKSIR